jgi:hypothetical protein
MAVFLQGLPYLRPTEHAELQRALAVALRVQTDAAGTREGAVRSVLHARLLHPFTLSCPCRI